MANKRKKSNQKSKDPIKRESIQDQMTEKSYETRGSKRKGQKGVRGNERPYGGNDVSWYNRNPALLEMAANIPFPYQPGREIPAEATYFVPGDLETTTVNTAVRYPGICTIGFYPSVGLSEDVSSPINIAAREIYGRIRSKYSGSLEADAPDIMMYLLALDSLYMIYEDLKRAYYLINVYTPYNNLFPKQIITALGYNFNDLMTNKTKLYQYLVEGGAMLAKFRVPDNMDLYKRHAFMSANIYADSPLPKAQQYAFSPYGFYQLTDVDKVTTLEIENWNRGNSTNMSVETAWSKFKGALNLLMSWDTGYTILGYLERAYEGESFLIPGAPIQDGQILPVYNLEVLTQIQNTRALPVSKESLAITQDPATNNLISIPTVDVSAEMDFHRKWRYVKASNFITLPTIAQPTAADIAVATRLHPSIGAFPSSKLTDEDQFIKIYCGTEVVCSIAYWNRESNFPSGRIQWTDVLVHMHSDAGETHAALFDEVMSPILGLMADCSAFNMHPNYFIYLAVWDFDGTELVAGKHALVADTDNLTVVEDTVLENLHRICIYSEFNCFPTHN